MNWFIQLTMHLTGVFDGFIHGWLLCFHESSGRHFGTLFVSERHESFVGRCKGKGGMGSHEDTRGKQDCWVKYGLMADMIRPINSGSDVFFW